MSLACLLFVSSLSLAQVGGTGNGSVTVTISGNTGPLPRVGTVTIAGQTFTVTQAGCVYTISATSASFGVGAGSGGFAVTPDAPTCQWGAVSSAPWLTVTSGASGTGNGSVSFSISKNPAGPKIDRTATITVVDKIFTVTQK